MADGQTIQLLWHILIPGLMHYLKYFPDILSIQKSWNLHNWYWSHCFQMCAAAVLRWAMCNLLPHPGGCHTDANEAAVSLTHLKTLDLKGEARGKLRGWLTANVTNGKGETIRAHLTSPNERNRQGKWNLSSNLCFVSCFQPW